MKPQQLNWCEPLTLANSLGSAPLALLYSSAQTSYSGRISLLGANLLETVEVAGFDALAPLLAKDKPRYAHCWFGYLGYGLKHDAERYTVSPPGSMTFPRGRLMRFSDVYVFDHAARTLTLWSAQMKGLPALRPLAAYTPPQARGLSSNMSRQDYEEKVTEILEAIHAGNLYQANLTRKFRGHWQEAPDGLALFARLCEKSPAPYSSYLRMEDGEILSSSPELFLRLEADGTVTTRPIKGTAPRGASAAEDEALKRALQASGKNRAENLMITDLMRNDLAKSCSHVVAGELFDVTPHAAIFHMASTVSGRLQKTIPDLLRGSFPPGSMTGAPKIRAVELCNRLEQAERGVYSGGIGWFGSDGTMELSVVIRTLLLQGNRFEFQVGGGIVADSTPAGEWAETMDKSMGILKTLDIPRNALEAL